MSSGATATKGGKKKNIPDPPPGHVRPIVFFDVAIGDTKLPRIKIELFDDVVPRTVANFRALCVGSHRVHGVPQGYKNSLFHRVVHAFMIQGGDFVNGDGTGSFSIYGGRFEDENFDISHDAPGYLSMANSGKDTNGCQFFITTVETTFLDGKHTVFGRILPGDNQSMLSVRKIEAVPTGAGDRPKLVVRIVECGEM